MTGCRFVLYAGVWVRRGILSMLVSALCSIVPFLLLSCFSSLWRNLILDCALRFTVSFATLHVVLGAFFSWDGSGGFGRALHLRCI